MIAKLRNFQIPLLFKIFTKRMIQIKLLPNLNQLITLNKFKNLLIHSNKKNQDTSKKITKISFKKFI